MNPVGSLPQIDVVAAAIDAHVVLLDLREDDEWDHGHAPTAVHIPLSRLVERVGELDRDRRIVCLCRSGNRSARATAWLLQQGFEAENMAGGMQAWARAGHPVVDRVGRPGAVI